MSGILGTLLLSLLACLSIVLISIACLLAAGAHQDHSPSRRVVRQSLLFTATSAVAAGLIHTTGSFFATLPARIAIAVIFAIAFSLLLAQHRERAITKDADAAAASTQLSLASSAMMGIVLLSASCGPAMALVIVAALAAFFLWRRRTRLAQRSDSDDTMISSL